MVYVGGALAFGWFVGVPAWRAAVLAAILELGLAVLWYAFWLENRRDTRRLNKRLRQFRRGP